MSYQPIPQQQVVAAPRRGAALVWIGIVCILIGLVTGAGLYFAAQSRFDSKVKSLAEDSGALSGCVTDLAFTKTGTFVFYYLSSGDVRVNGDNEGCAASDVVTIDAPDEVPDIEVILTDDGGERVRLGSTSLDEDSALSAGGVTAWPYRAATINAAGNYTIEITAPEGTPRFAIGVGAAIEEPTVVLPVVIGLAGLVLGVVLIVIGFSRRNRLDPIPAGYAYPQQAYPPAGYQQPGYQQPGYQQPGYQQPGYQQPPYQQPGYQQPGQPPAQYPNQPPVVYNPPTQEGFDHPTQSMPPIVTSPEPVGPFEQGGWSVPGQPLPPPAQPQPQPPDDEQR